MLRPGLICDGKARFFVVSWPGWEKPGIMASENETFESLWEFCTSNNRLCPMPMRWNDLFNMLKNRDSLDLPLILNGWEMSSPLEKNLRFKDHIQAAAGHNQLDEIGKYLRSLNEEDWAHFGEV